MNIINSLAVFCGSSTGNNQKFTEEAVNLGKELYKRNIRLIYGGGNLGLMGKTADTLSSLGGYVIGILPESLNLPKVCNKQVESERIIVKDMHERKAQMYRRADAFIALPGGIGTYEELMEVYTWLQLGYHRKPVGILNIDGFYDGLLQQLRHSMEEGFLKKDILGTLVVATDCIPLLDGLSKANLDFSAKL
ncbi:MAG: TIGR00730 family Rossman fold protein [Spirochaetia bacterium]|jgi:uncharacterized protein (TIGR00730 family)|nr:TIGR00730 family Rossman fold protein [Spirochaetia bacterium]